MGAECRHSVATARGNHSLSRKPAAGLSAVAAAIALAVEELWSRVPRRVRGGTGGEREGAV